MTNQLRICIVGGRSFGKTALVKAVAQIPCFIAKNNRDQKNKFDAVSFKLENTKWNDVKDWRFDFTDEDGGGEKLLSFADYAGEYFEEAYEDASTEDDKKDWSKVFGKLIDLLSRLWPWGGHKSDKRRIDKLFYHPDGVIILLPRDFGKKENGGDVYKRSIYEDRVWDYLEKLRPGTPVQIVISKWDLNGELDPKGASEDEVVSSSAFKNFYARFLNCYRSRNGRDYDAGVMGISVKASRNGDWIDFENFIEGDEHYNVRALFTKLSHAADVARTERLKADWGQAKWWKRFFIMPWRSLSVYRKNSTDGEIKSIFGQSWLRFGGFLVASAVVAFATIVSVAGLTEKFRLDGIDSEIAAATNALPKVTKAQLADLDAQLATNKWTHPMFFIPRLAELKRKQWVLKDAFVKYLEEDLVTQLKNPRVLSKSPWDVHPEVLDERASNRLAIVENQIARLPEGRVSDAMQSNKTEELRVIANLKADRLFNQALYDIGMTNENAKLRAMDMVRKDLRGKFSYRTNDFVKLDVDITNLEGELSSSLSNRLSQLEREHPAHDLQGRTKLATLKITAISNMLDNVFIPGSEIYQNWSKRLDAFKQDMAKDNLYDPLQKAYAVLNTNDLHAISKFKQDYPQDKFPECNGLFRSLDGQERNLIQRIMNSVTQSEKMCAYSDTTKTMPWRIEKATSLTNAYVVALGKLRENDGEYDQLNKKRQSTAEWIDDHKKYLKLDADLKSAMATDKTNRVHAIVIVVNTYDKDAYSEYTNRLAEAHNHAVQLSAKFVQDCTNEIVVARGKKQRGSWQVAVNDASNRIAKIEAVLPSVLECDRPTLENLIKQEKDEIARLSSHGQRYDPFDKDYADLDLGDLNAISRFKKNYPRVKYMDRKNVYEALDTQERNLLSKIMKGVGQSEMAYADDANKSMRWRIDRAASRTNAYSVALEKLRKSDGEYDVLSKKRQSTEVWISDHKKYMDYETDWDGVVAKPETERVRAIVEFLRNHKEEMYPEYAGRLVEAGEAAKKLSAQFVQDCTNEIIGIRGKQSGSWQAYVRDASNRIEKIEAILPSVLESDKPKLVNLINQEENDIVKWTKNGRFGDRFAKVMQMPKEKVLRGIIDFRDDFPEVDFPGHGADYVALSNKEIKALGDINTTFTNALAKILEPVATNFLGRLEQSKKILQANKRALDFIPEDHPASEGYRQGRNRAAENVEKYAKWIKMREAAYRLLNLAKDAENGSDVEILQVQKLIIKNVGGFYDKYPEKDNPDGELHEIYKKVKDVLTEAEVRIQKRYQEEDERYVSRNKTSMDETIEIINSRIRLIDEYLTIFLKDSDPHNTLIKVRDDLSRMLTDNERDKLFRKDFEECRQKVGKSQSASEAIDVIEQFVSKYKNPDWLCKETVKEAIRTMEKEKGQLMIRKQFDNLEKEKVSLVATRPTDDEDDSEKLIEYKKHCLELKEKFNTIKQHGNVQNRVEQSIADLDREEKWVNGKLGDGTWSDIKKKKAAYIDDPSFDTYKVLVAALDTFDSTKEGNGDYKKRVEELKRVVQDDWNTAAKVDEAWNRFKNDYNMVNYKSFGAVYSECLPPKDGGQQEIRVKREQARVRYSDVANCGSLQPKIELIRLSFAGSAFSHSKRESHIHLTYKVGNEYEDFVEADNMPDVWESRMPCGSIVGSFEQNPIIGPQGITFKLVNETGFDKEGFKNIPIWELIADGVEYNGAYTYPVKIQAGEAAPATLTFKFSGLPTLK